MPKSIDELIVALDPGNAEVAAKVRETLQLARAFSRIRIAEHRTEVIRLVEAKADEDEATRLP